jgi:DNA-binding HxlR family transcriptional regulator
MKCSYYTLCTMSVKRTRERKRVARQERERFDFLIELFHNRFAVPILGELSVRGGGGRVVELASALGASRGGVAGALRSLTDRGLLTRNVGHGHPLRPEYLLTSAGEAVATEAGRIVTLVGRWAIQDHAFRKWSLPVAYGLGEQGARFSELRSRLPGITDRALSDALRTLVTARLTIRSVEPSHPPRVLYLPTGKARDLLDPLRRLADAA